MFAQNHGVHAMSTIVKAKKGAEQTLRSFVYVSVVYVIVSNIIRNENRCINLEQNAKRKRFHQRS